MDSGTSTPLAHTVDEAIKRISISRTTMYELIKAGEIRPLKLGRKTLIAESELQRFLGTRMAQAQSVAAVSA